MTGCNSQKRMAPQVGLEPTTLRLTAGCSAIELLRTVGCRNFKYLAAQMTTHGYLKDQTVTRRRVLCDPYLTHVFSGQDSSERNRNTEPVTLIIRDVAGLLRALQEAEAQQIEKAGITHAPTIGEMYEGLTEKILEKLIPAAADLRIVSGFVEAHLEDASGQIDFHVEFPVRAHASLIPDDSNGRLKMSSPSLR